VVAVVVIVAVVDGGCASVVSGDVAHSGGDDGLEGVSSWGAVCIKASAVEEVVWVLEFVVTHVGGSVCMPLLNSALSRFSRSAALPRSSPSFTPLSYPAFSPSTLPISNCAIPATFNALVNPSFAFRNPSSRPSFMISS
jgi:hypothetical protein